MTYHHMTALVEDASGAVVAPAETFAWSGTAEDLASKIFSQAREADGPRVVKVWLGGNANTATAPAAIWPVPEPEEATASGKSGGRRRAPATVEPAVEDAATTE